MSEKRVLNTKEYKNYLRSVLKRHFNEADEAARLRVKRRRLEEDLSLVTPLNVEFPDDAGAFTNLLLELYVRGAPGLKRDHKYQQALREQSDGTMHEPPSQTFRVYINIPLRYKCEGYVILLPDSDDRPITNKPIDYIKNWKIVVLDCHDLQWEGLRLGDFDGKTYAIPERRPPRSALPLLSFRHLPPPSSYRQPHPLASVLDGLRQLSEGKLDSFFGAEDAAFENEIDVEKEVKSDIAHLCSQQGQGSRTVARSVRVCRPPRVSSEIHWFKVSRGCLVLTTSG
ncbi:hypothetical protein V8E54_002592 [Elaphomyces granulatus]